MRDSNYDRIVSSIYGSVLVDGSFSEAVAAFGAQVGSHLNAFQRQDFGDASGEIDVSGILNACDFSDHLSDYGRRWAGENIWMSRSQSGLLERGCEFSDRVVPTRELFGTDFYRFVLCPLDIAHGCAITLSRTHTTLVTVSSFHRTRAAGPWQDGEIALIRRVMPHLQQAWRIREQWRALQVQNATLEQAFARLPVAVFLLDGTAAILRANEAAQGLLDDPDSALFALKGTLRPRDDRACTALRGLLQQWAARPDQAWAHTLQVEAPDGRPALVLRLAALPRQARDARPGGLAVLAFAVPIGTVRPAALAAALVAEALRLTPAETRLALALWSECSLEAAASVTGVALATARTQLKHVFAKSGLHSQNALLQAIERLMVAARCY